ncbi:hypothetical protein Poly21_46270 [Allorhodopirellula heiligendammensis]|uniref:Uncharacterized protein n=1 Tax=Allorhodopirellula heiligendammensis TaxID=2714739 RepID=A0A5C6BGU9_9BACT|nr:hypothetical protein Poly21_46270 [Allorhodopirellula heiligendammensis]
MLPHNNQLLLKKNMVAFAQHETRPSFQWSPIGSQRLHLFCL